MTTAYLARDIEIDGQPAAVVKMTARANDVDHRGVLDTAKFDLAIDFSNVDQSKDELVLVVRLVRETEYVS